MTRRKRHYYRILSFTRGSLQCPLTAHRLPLTAPAYRVGLRVTGGERDPVGEFAVEADLERVLAWAGKGNVEYQDRSRLDVDYASRGLTELHRSFTAEELVATLVDKTNTNGVNANFRATPADPEDQMGTGVHRWEVGQPDVLEHPEHTQLSLLVDQGVISDNGKVEVQLQLTRIDVMTSFCRI
ncbi:MAG TPA: hypothetical protein VFD73_17525 [Gemmatimonadales bacterium]|jgi:hypothetical protein|nr:hypothetical protein [Gemmatimonadales bacterium]